MSSLLVFCHLRWNFVYQRPQHLLSRLGTQRRVYVIEEPMRSDGPAHLERHEPSPGVVVLRPHTPVDAAGFHDDQLPTLRALIADFLAAESIDDYVLVRTNQPVPVPVIAAAMASRC